MKTLVLLLSLMLAAPAHASIPVTQNTVTAQKKTADTKKTAVKASDVSKAVSAQTAVADRTAAEAAVAENTATKAEAVQKTGTAKKAELGNAAAKKTNAAAKAKDIRTVTFKSSMHCKNCVKKLTDNLAYAKGVKDLDISLEKNTVTVTYDASKTDEETLAAIIKKLGYTAVCEQPAE